MTQLAQLSPKLYPALLGIGIGAVMIALGQKEAGFGILGTGALALIAGYQLPVGEVVAQPTPGPGDPQSDVVLPGEGSDQRLDPTIVSSIAVESGSPVEEIVDALSTTVTAVGGLIKKRP